MTQALTAGGTIGGIVRHDFSSYQGSTSPLTGESLVDDRGLSSALRSPDGVDCSLPLGLRFLPLLASSLAQLILGSSSLSLLNLLSGRDCLKMVGESYFGSSVAAFPTARPLAYEDS